MLQLSAPPQALWVALAGRLERRTAAAVAERHVCVERGGVVGSGSAQGTLDEHHTVSGEEVHYRVVYEREGRGTDLTAVQASWHLGHRLLRRLGEEILNQHSALSFPALFLGSSFS